jgi:hypothetical protein
MTLMNALKSRLLAVQSLLGQFTALASRMLLIPTGQYGRFTDSSLALVGFLRNTRICLSGRASCTGMFPSDSAIAPVTDDENGPLCAVFCSFMVVSDKGVRLICVFRFLVGLGGWVTGL